MTAETATRDTFTLQVLFAVIFIYVISKLISWYRNPLRKIPGPTGSLLFGNTGEIFAPNDGHRVVIEWGRKYGEIFKAWSLVGMLFCWFYSQGQSPSEPTVCLFFFVNSQCLELRRNCEKIEVPLQFRLCSSSFAAPRTRNSLQLPTQLPTQLLFQTISLTSYPIICGLPAMHSRIFLKETKNSG